MSAGFVLAMQGSGATGAAIDFFHALTRNWPGIRKLISSTPASSVGHSLAPATVSKEESAVLEKKLLSGSHEDYQKAMRQPVRTTQFGVSMAAYERIQKGMSYEQVRAIIGEPGVETSRSDVGGYSTVMYSWKKWGGSMNAMFQNGGLVSKAQFGLR